MVVTVLINTLCFCLSFLLICFHACYKNTIKIICTLSYVAYKFILLRVICNALIYCLLLLLMAFINVSLLHKFSVLFLLYLDSVIDDALCEQRLWDMKHRGDQNFYMCEIHKDFTIDATFKGNASRFLNHNCDPNCKLEKW